MTSERVHDAFALLLREREGRNAVLSALAVRRIRRHVASRWAGALGILLAGAFLGAASLGWETASDDSHATYAAVDATSSLPIFGFSDATFPLTGGPEFTQASATLRCGDAMPQPHPESHDLRLTISEGTTFSLGDDSLATRPLTVQATVKQVVSRDQGAIASSGIDFLVVKDGIVRGMLNGSGVSLAQNVVGGAISIPQKHLLTDGVFCPDGERGTPADLAPGTYEVVAIGRVFSTPESVALSEALGDTINVMYLSTNELADPTTFYLPGMYNCTTPRTWDSALRGCLADISSNAMVNESAGTVTVVYRVDSLVDEFSSVLVSEPLTVELVSSQGFTAQ